MTYEKAPMGRANSMIPATERKTKFKGYGEEMIERVVKRSGSSGRVYLPSEWVGRNVKIIRLD